MIIWVWLPTHSRTPPHPLVWQTATYGPTLETAVGACARLNAVPMLSVCLAAGADPTIKDGLGFCPLSRAVAGGHFQVCRFARLAR